MGFKFLATAPVITAMVSEAAAALLSARFSKYAEIAESSFSDITGVVSVNWVRNAGASTPADEYCKLE